MNKEVPHLPIGHGTPLFIVWLRYQRRAETLAPLLGCRRVSYLPHRFKSRYFRPLDYIEKLIRTFFLIRRADPPFVILQTPPIFAAISSIVARTPYVVDAHNASLQSYWSRIPLTRTLMKKAATIITHNFEFEEAMRVALPTSYIVTIPDPMQSIAQDQGRLDHVLFICSFDRDEPVSVIIETIRAMPDLMFTITADSRRLNKGLREALQSCYNLRLTGFLPTEEYHALLCSARVAVVLSTRESVQPSGAIEALSSNTPLIVSRSSLTETLFGDWAHLTNNDVPSLIAALRSLPNVVLDLHRERDRWNTGVNAGIEQLQEYLGKSTGQEQETFHQR